MNHILEKFDVVIIGASISGNYLAFLLSKFNLNTAIIEEHREIGLPFQCAGIISKKLTQLIDLPENIILNQVKVAKIFSPSGIFIKLSGEEQPYIIDRVALDKLFYQRIKNKNKIKYYLEEKFISFQYITEKSEKSIMIETNKRKIKSKMLVGCDGPLSSVSKIVGIKNDIIIATQIRIKANFDQNEAIMWFDPRWKELFGWVVPEGNKIYRIGLASSKNVAKNFQIFLNNLGVDFSERLDQQGGIIPYGTMHKSAFDNILLIGDAAGQVKATTGGGIVMLLTAAKYAASCIKKCFEKNEFSKKFIKKYYEKPCKISIGKQLKIHFIVRTFFENFTGSDYDTLFQIIKTNKIEEIVSLYGDMDFPRDMVMKLLKNSMFIKFIAKILKKNPLIIIKILKILI
ncbi:MAG: geranylgeranyl reductase family protein [Promethearchaeota archaeon]